jgi:hypothetical protein
MTELKRILMQRDGLTRSEAENVIDDCREMLMQGFDPDDVMLGELGLELDYLMDLIG